MASDPGFARRVLFKSGLAVSAVGALGSLGSGAAAAAAAAPEIFGTDEWDARAPSDTITVLNRKPTYIVVHHTVDPGNSDDYSKEHAFAISRSIQNFHMDTRGWSDTGQQFTNSRGGYVTEGRHRSLEVLRDGTRLVQGANVLDHNSEVVGIENEGLYSTVDVPDALWNSLVDLVAYIADQYGISPEFIKGHRDFNSTECPGQVLYERLPELRTAVGDKLGVAVRQPLEWPLLKPGDTGKNVRTAQELLRAQGASAVPVDGVFGPTTKTAVSALAARHGLEVATCYAGAHADETGFLGSDIWPLLTAGSRSTQSWREQLAAST